MSENILEDWAMKMGVVLTFDHYLDFQRALITKELTRLNIPINFSNNDESKIDCQSFAILVADAIINKFNIDEEDIGIMGMLKRDLEALNNSEQNT